MSELVIMFYLIVFVMKTCEKITKCLIVCVVIGLPCFSFASWKESACNNVTQERPCTSVSDNYKQPYCITNVNHNRGDQDVDNASSCILPIFTNKFSEIAPKTTTKDIINNYCQSLFGELSDWRIYFAKSTDSFADLDWQQTFDSHQSLFLYALCSSFKDSDWNMPFISSNNLLSEVYKWDLVKTLNLQQRALNGKNYCSLEDEPSLNRCDIGMYTTKIFAWIMSDLFKIEYAQVLAVDDAENFEANKKIQEFMSWYYNITDSSELKEIEKTYKKTVSQLKSDQKYYKNVLDTVRIIDNEKLVALVKESWCPMKWTIVWMDFIACALHSSQWRGKPLTPSFVTLLYNELLHYRHFVAYYTYASQSRFDKSSEKLEEEAKSMDFQRYADMQVEAFELAEHNFEEFSMTYPLHIWMLMYIEKVEKFRNNFTDVVTSFYSLSEKLQNVQERSY